MGFLDEKGLAHFWGKIRAGLGGKQDALSPDDTITLQDGNIGVALPSKALTRAEYDALTDAQKKAPVLYAVTDGVPGGASTPLSIQEYNTDDGWHVRKWSDGYVEMSLVREFTSESTMITWNGWRFFTRAIPSVDLPIPLVSRRNESAFVVSPPSDMEGVENGDSGYTLLQRGVASLTRTCAYSFMSNYDFHSTKLTVAISVTGFWKWCEAMNAYFNGNLITGPRGPAGNPVGTIISYLGLTAPTDYLICDGAEYSVSDYPELASFFESQFGAKNHFGGDGTATFAVPDMRNLFLRGYHGEAEEHLSGEVGIRQDATNHVNIVPNADAARWAPTAANPDGPAFKPQNSDSVIEEKISGAAAANSDTSVLVHPTYTSRPVNMAVLYCIKTV